MKSLLILGWVLAVGVFACQSKVGAVYAETTEPLSDSPVTGVKSPIGKDQEAPLSCTSCG